MTSNPPAGARPNAPKESLFTRDARSTREAFLQGLYFGSLRLLGNPLAMIGLTIIAVLVLVAAFAPLLATHDPLAQDLNNALSPPSAAHWFGTDELGRDIYSRVVYGSRVTLYIVGLVTVTVAPIGIAVGTTSGYFGGAVDTIMMRITDLFLSFPSLVLTLAFVAALGPGLENAVVAIALTAWPPVARLARAEANAVKAQQNGTAEVAAADKEPATA